MSDPISNEPTEEQKSQALAELKARAEATASGHPASRAGLAGRAATRAKAARAAICSSCLSEHVTQPGAPEDPLAAELRLICRDEVALISERTARRASLWL